MSIYRKLSKNCTLDMEYALRYKEYNFISVAVRNVPKFDNHLILETIAQIFKNNRFLCVAENCEKFIFFQLKKIFYKTNKKWCGLH